MGNWNEREGVVRKKGRKYFLEKRQQKLRAKSI
jgi:hypothetical protein